MKFFSSKTTGKGSSGIFVPEGGVYKELTVDVLTGSINDISRCLHYHPDQVHSYFGKSDESSDIEEVVLEVFTLNVGFVMTKKSVTSLNHRKVAQFLRDFDVKEEFNSTKAKEILQNGIDNKSLRFEFLARVLKISTPEPNGIFFVDSLNLYLYFSNGYLVDFQSSNGLNEWAMDLKRLNPNWFQKFEDESKQHWGNNTGKIINEINIQAEALFDTPQALKNEYIPLHTNTSGTINFFMLLVCHYNQEINLNLFQEVNHGRYKELPLDEESFTHDIRKFKLGKFNYEFLSDGSLRKCYLAA